MAKLKLEVEDTERLVLIGIQSSWPEHKIVWSINKHLKLRFTRLKDFAYRTEINNSENLLFESDNEYYFSVFVHQEEEEHAILVANIGQGYTLYDKLRRLDYLLKIDSSRFDLSEVTDKLSEIRGITAITKVECSLDELVARPFSEFV